MACKCKVNRDLEYLHRRYGNDVSVSKNRLRAFRSKENLKRLFVLILVLPLIPLMAIHVIYKSFSKNNRISITKMLGLRHV